MKIKIISDKRCIIGEGPVWNAAEKRLYFTNGMGNEICMFDPDSQSLKVRSVKTSVAAFAFSRDNRMIVSRRDGVFVLNDDDSVTELYDNSAHTISFANDMKVGPDGRIYVGTQSGVRVGVSDKTDGRLYSIDKHGKVRVLLENLRLSNGLEWSMDERKFYHTDSDTGIIKEYDFDSKTGDISFTGRQISVPGVDGFTIDTNNNLYVACWGKGYIAVVDIVSMSILSYIEIPAGIPASCGFAGEKLDVLAVTTASYKTDIKTDENAGYTILVDVDAKGRSPYLFG